MIPHYCRPYWIDVLVFQYYRWVMGKIVDSVADTLSIPNFNNMGDREKLKLFRSVDGVSVCEDMSLDVKTILDKEDLFNGDKVLLEYVENNEDIIDISWGPLVKIDDCITELKILSKKIKAKPSCLIYLYCRHHISQDILGSSIGLWNV